MVTQHADEGDCAPEIGEIDRWHDDEIDEEQGVVER
jgi:hypothetical protein